MKRLHLFSLVTLLVAGLLAGCGNNPEPAREGAPPTVTGLPAEPGEIEQEGETPTEIEPTPLPEGYPAPRSIEPTPLPESYPAPEAIEPTPLPEGYPAPATP